VKCPRVIRFGVAKVACIVHNGVVEIDFAVGGYCADDGWTASGKSAHFFRFEPPADLAALEMDLEIKLWSSTTARRARARHATNQSISVEFADAAGNQNRHSHLIEGKPTRY
jgi:hypothetical protein